MSPPPRRRLSPAERREQLLDTALDLAAGTDLSALSVQEIAARAGVSEGLLYHYFPTKDALLLAALRRAADALMAALDVAAQGSPMASLRAGLGAYLDHVQADPTGWRVVLQAHSGALAEIAVDVEQHGRSLMLRSLDVTEPSPALRLALDGWAAFEREACLTWLDHPTLGRDAVEDLLETSFLAALSAAARHDTQAQAVLERLAREAPPA